MCTAFSTHCVYHICLNMFSSVSFLHSTHQTVMIHSCPNQFLIIFIPIYLYGQHAHLPTRRPTMRFGRSIENRPKTYVQRKPVIVFSFHNCLHMFRIAHVCSQSVEKRFDKGFHLKIFDRCVLWKRKGG